MQTESPLGAGLVPRSHLTGVDPADVPPEDESRLICRAGSVLVYDGGIIHGGGENASDEVRYSIQGFFCRSSRKPFCDHTRSVPREIVDAETPLMRRLWGFASQPCAFAHPIYPICLLLGPAKIAWCWSGQDVGSRAA